MATKPACPVCGTKKWVKSRTGEIFCKNGHILQGYRNETNEATEFTPHAAKKRELKSTRVKKEKKSHANPILYHGDRARYHYFLCLQILLRMQFRKLMELWSLPPEFEAICRDIWAMHLSLLSSPPPPEPFLHSQEQESSSARDGKDDSSGRKYTERTPRENEGAAVSQSFDTESSSSLDDDDKIAHDPKMDDLLREASEDESSESERGEEDPQVTGISRKRRARWLRDDSPVGTICVLVLSCWFLRIPVIYQDFTSLIETYTLPYLEPDQLLPPSLTRHLTKHTKQALSPHHAPTPMVLHTITSRLSRLCLERYGISTPEMSAAPILWRAVHHMGGTPSLYGAAKALARYLELPLMVNKSLAPPLLKQTNKDPTSHINDTAPPEVTLVATVIIALKLIYGLDDGKDVTPIEGWDPAHTMPTLDVYMDHLRVLDASDINNSRRDFTGSSSYISELQNEDERCLDAYLDFCERALLGRASDADSTDLAGDHFPLREGMEADASPRSDENVSDGGDGAKHDDSAPVLAATPRVCGEFEDRSSTMRPGEKYAIFSREDLFGRLPDKYAIVLSRASRMSGVSENDLSTVMERFERRLVRQWKRSKRRPQTKDDEEDGDE